MTTRNLFKLIIAGALALGGALQTQGHAAEIPPFDVYVVPPKPTTADELTLIATVDVNGLFCGRALALGPFLPDAPEIDMFAVPLVPSASCPAVVEVRQLRFPLGRLDAGEHVVQVYLPLDDSFELETLLNFEVSETPTDTPTLGGGRFAVLVHWQDFEGGAGVGRVAPNSTDDSLLLWFFSPNNWELLVKVLDGCSLNGHYWILGSGATTVPFTLEVRDLETGAVWEHVNPSGQPAGTFIETSFSSCP